MITVWTKRDSIPADKDVVIFNDAFFDLYTKDLVGSEQDLAAIKAIDDAEPAEYKPYYKTPFGVARPENFSTGCKTVLNILHHPNKIFDTIECGKNAVQHLVYLDDICFVCEILPVRLQIKNAITVDGELIEDTKRYKEWWGVKYESP